MSGKLCLSYALPAPETWITNLKLFDELVAEFANEFLEKVWDEEIIDDIHAYGLKVENGKEYYTKPAYKYFERRKLYPNDPRWKELPSRFRRGIMEKVGRVLRSQKERKDCFYDVLPLFPDYYDLSVEDIRKRKWKAFKRIRQKLIASGKYYDYNLLKQTVYQIANYYEENGELPKKYTECVRPRFNSGTFPFDVDDGRIGFGKLSKDDRGKIFQLCYRVKDGKLKLHLRVKLPVKRKDGRIEWRWFEEDVEAYQKFKEMLANRIKKPVLVKKRLKSGFYQYRFVFPFEVKDECKPSKDENYFRFLSIDLNERKLIAAVVMDSENNQLTPPIFVRTLPEIREKILRIREEISNISRKISSNLDFDGRLFAERRRKWTKLNNLVDQLTHEVANVIVRIAQVFGCKYIVFEDLKSYQPPKGRGLLSWLLSMWRRGNIVTITRYKALRKGIEVKTVKAFMTSQICPRCNARGEHVKAPNRLTEKDIKYGFFYCPDCRYTADRDYVAALNIGRRFLLDGNGGKGSLRLDGAEPAAYKAVGGSPADRSRRGKQKKQTRLGEKKSRSVTFSNVCLFLSRISVRFEKLVEWNRRLSLVNNSGV